MKLTSVTPLVVAVFALLTWPAVASADEVDRASSAPSAREAEARQERAVALEVNPLAMGLSRFGGNVEFALSRHHGFIVSGFYARRDVSLVSDDVATTVPSFGGELGHRYYFGPRPLEGLFAGASVLVERVVPDHGTYGTVLLGGAFDVGGQIVTRGGWSFAAGAGLQMTRGTVSRVDVSSGPVLSGAGVYPRLLASTGFAF